MICMSDKTVKISEPGDMQKYIADMLSACSLSITDAVNAAAEKVGKEAVSKLKSTSPRRKGKGGGDYAKGWRVQVKKAQADGSFSMTVYNAKHGSLTHLLEKGHPIIKNGVKVGDAKPKPHIAAVNDWVQTEGFKQIGDAVQKAINKTK